MYWLANIAFVLISFSSFCQETQVPAPPESICTTIDDIDTTIVEFPDEEAQFPGGYAELKKYILDNFKYQNIDFLLDRIYVRFIVEIDGSVTNLEILQSVSSEGDRKALKLIRKMPRWEPAKLNKNPVRSAVQVPIRVTLN